MELTKLSNLGQKEKDLVKEQFAMDVLTGLYSKPKSISAKYFYDDLGSQIFQDITKHDDYYPTKIEFEILDKIKSIIPTLIDSKEIDIIELGAGDGHKSHLLIKGFLDQNISVNFYPIDISEKAMILLEENITSHPKLKIHGVVSEYMQGLQFLRRKSSNKKLVLFLGSNIGNFDRIQSQVFLRRLWQNLDDSDHILIGFDLKKNVDTLLTAYNDSAGHTKKFNLNLLARINNELGGNFDLTQFDHFGTYNPSLGAMESYLLSNTEQKVYISKLERSFQFHKMEPIHLEYSFKFLKRDVDYLSEQTGFKVIEHFTDPKDYFLDSLWEVKKETSKN